MHSVVPSVEDLTNPSSKTDEICTHCNKSFKGISALKRHLRRSHSSQLVSVYKLDINYYVAEKQFNIKSEIYFAVQAASSKQLPLEA